MHPSFPSTIPGVAAGCALAWLLCGVAVAGASSPPVPGRYAGRMCVQPLSDPQKPADCGPAEVWVQRSNRAQVRISDIVYRLALSSSQVDVVLMHGRMQIDSFTAVYDWQGATLQFSDRGKGMRYEVHLGAPVAAPR